MIDREGKIIQLVEDLKIAWHAGKSRWKKFRSLNKNSIGIEISNPGHKLGYKNFKSQQLNSLKKSYYFQAQVLHIFQSIPFLFLKGKQE